MSHYARGRRAEWAVRDALQDDGYVVLRTAGSKGAVDLIAVKPGQTLAVQVKTNGRLETDSWNRLWSLATNMRAIPILADVAPRKPIVYLRLTGVKIPRSRLKPWEPFLTDEAGE